MTTKLANREAEDGTHGTGLLHSRQWFLIGGGFAVGILFGGYLLLKGENASGDSSVRPDEANRRAANALPVSSPNSEVTSADDNSQLLAETTRLREELERARLKKELAVMRRELNDLTHGVPRDAVPQSSPDARPPRSPTGTASSPGERTLQYWNGMNEIIARESAMRMTPAGGVSGANAADFLNRRIEAAEFAAGGIRRLDRSRVDAEVVSLADEISDWYEQEVHVSTSGRSLLEGGDVRARRGLPGKQWQNAELDHRKQVESINHRGARLRDKLSKKYGLAFPELQ